MHLLIYAIFALTYLLIASRELRFLPIGRSAGALLGAVLMVAAGALTPAESYAAIDHDTLLLIFAMMMLTAYLALADFFERMAAFVLGAVRGPLGLLVALSLLAGVLSAFLLNDTVCLFLTPVVVAACRKAELPPGPYLIALATSANIGSAATLVGNPQNMIIGHMSGIPFAAFMACAGPAAAAGLAVNILLLWLYYGRRLPRAFARAEVVAPRPSNGRLPLALAVAAGVTAGFFAGFHLGYTALAGVMVLILADRREPKEALARVDWPLLVFFACLFIVVAGLAKTGLVERAWSAAAPRMALEHWRGAVSFTALVTLGSNLVSNVPMVLLTGPHLPALGGGRLGWVLLAYVSTVAGNFTLIGSVANIIVAEGAKEHYVLGFWEYLRFGVVSTFLVLAAGVAVIYLRS